MTVKYIFHSGFLLETAASCYIFDYYKGTLPPFDTKKPVVVFSSHAHRDHYNPEIFSILRKMGVTDILAVLAKDIPEKKYPKDIKVLKAYANTSYILPHGEKLETLLSTDSGVAYLLTTDEGTVYHAGDLNDWTWDGESDDDNRQMRGSYRHEIDKLKGKEIDIAFVPLDPRQDEHYADGLGYFLSAAGAKSVYPMHYWEKPEIVDRYLRENPQYKSVMKYTENNNGGKNMRFKMIHENFNVTDLDASLAFYKKALGLTELRRKTTDSFTIVFIGNAESDFEMELTCLKDHPQKYDLGEDEFHLAFRTDDYASAHKLHEEMGCICYENPSIGLYFIEDPDGYWLEILPAER